LILRNIVEWSNPEYIPIHNRRDLARVHRTPHSVVWVPCGLNRSLNENLYPPSMDSQRHDKS